jgi:two-component system, NarL family, response regulator DesR
MTPSGGPAIRVFVADDHTMMRSALITLLELEDDLEVVGHSGRGDDAVDQIVALQPDVALLDITMPGLDGLQVAVQVAERAPECKTVILTAVGKPGELQQALRAKARGFILKHAPAEDLFAAIRSVFRGERVVDSVLAVAALDADSSAPTPREADVLRLIAGGASARQIAEALHLSEGTVRNYTSNLMARCAARNRVDLVRIARDRGWVY